MKRQAEISYGGQEKSEEIEDKDKSCDKRKKLEAMEVTITIVRQ